MQGMPKMQVQPLGWEDPPEGEMATHSCILAWRIPWTEEPGGLQGIFLIQGLQPHLSCLLHWQVVFFFFFLPLALPGEAW